MRVPHVDGAWIVNSTRTYEINILGNIFFLHLIKCVCVKVTLRCEKSFIKYKLKQICYKQIYFQNSKMKYIYKSWTK